MRSMPPAPGTPAATAPAQGILGVAEPRPAPDSGRAGSGARRALEATALLFSPESAALSSAARPRLDSLLPLLRAHPRARLLIEGHCALFGTARGRAALSLERARAAERWLRGAGWSPEPPPRVEGAGGLRPVSRSSGLQHLNRRVEIRFIEED